MLDQVSLLWKLLRTPDIVRRYFVTNGFDGAVAMVGLLVGLRSARGVELEVVAGACGAMAIALGTSGFSSAYLSESAEKQKELHELEAAMLTDLQASAHARAARVMPVAVALSNGLSPLLLALLIQVPLWLPEGPWLGLPPLDAAIALAFLVVFGLGVFVGAIGRTFWLWAGLRAVAVAVVTAVLVLLAR